MLDLQPGPQRAACASSAQILVYGGKAGGGKTRFTIHKMAAMAEMRPGFQGAIFRRTNPEIIGAGSIWEESEEVFSILGFEPTLSSPRRWTKGKSFIEFRSLEHEKDKYKHQSKQYNGLALDEATHFTEGQTFYLWARCRGNEDAFMILTCNPDPDSWLRDFIGWWLDEDGYPIQERAGKLRWFLRRGSEFIWGDTAAELDPYREDDKDDPTSVTFIPANLEDNKILLKKDPKYVARLRALLPFERAALAEGCWDARAMRGDYFQRGWFKMLSGTAIGRKLLGQPDLDDRLIAVVRSWDLAATPVLGDLVPGIKRPADFAVQRKDADWTRGIKVGKLKGGDLVVLDLVSCRDTPGAVRELRHRTAIADNPSVVVSVPQDPGQAGVDQVDRIKKDMRGLARVIGQSRSKDKTAYAKPVSEFVYSGRVWIMAGPWNMEFFREVEAFPPDSVSRRSVSATLDHDDIIDSFADAFRLLSGPVRAYNYEAVSEHICDQGQDSFDRDEDNDPEDNEIHASAGFRRGGLF